MGTITDRLADSRGEFTGAMMNPQAEEGRLRSSCSPSTPAGGESPQGISDSRRSRQAFAVSEDRDVAAISDMYPVHVDGPVLAEEDIGGAAPPEADAE